MFSKFFINRPIFCYRACAADRGGGIGHTGHTPHCAVSGHYAAYRSGQRRLSGCQRADSGPNRGYTH